MYIYVDENKNLIFFSWVDNPNFDLEREKQRMLDWMKERQEIMAAKRFSRPPINPPDAEPVSFPAQNPIILEYPYAPEDVIAAYEQTLRNVNQFPPYSTKRKDHGKDPLQFYTGFSKFREATCGKRMIYIVWKPKKKDVSLFLPRKASGMWLEIEHKIFDPSCAFLNFADTIIQFAQKDLTKHPTFKSNKSMLNL